MSLQQIFYTNYNSDTLADFVKLCTPFVLSSERLSRKDQRANYLADTLLNPKHIRQIWQALDDLSRKAVASAYHNGGEFVADAFVAQYGSLPERPRHSVWYYMQTPILLDLFIHQGQIPPELMPRLADLVPPSERFQIVGVEELDAVVKSGGKWLAGIMVAETEEAGWHDLLLFLQLCDQGVIKFNAAGDKLTPGGVATLLENLLHGDFYQPAAPEPNRRVGTTRAANSEKADGKSKPEDTIRPFGLAVFARSAGLITSYGRGGLTELGRAFLNRQEPEVLLDAFERWSKESLFDEITRIEAIKGLRSRNIHLTKPGMRRERIVEALSWCPVNVWINIAEFYRAIKIWHFDFHIEEGGIEKLYVGYRYGGGGYYEPWASSLEMWLLINGLYINAVLWEYLAVIGALDIAYVPPDKAEFEASPDSDFDGDYYSRYDGLYFFRINRLGAYLFGQAGDYQRVKAVDAPLFRIDANRHLKILDPARLTPIVKTQLDQIAVAQGEDIYHLDSQKLLLALEQGADLEALRDFLAHNSAEAMSPEVNRWLDQVYDASRAFSIDLQMVRIRVASDDLVQLVLADPELEKFCKALGKRELVIPSSRVSRFRLRLRELGYGLRSTH